MPETLAHSRPQRLYSADSPLAYLLDLATHSAGPGEGEQREDAVTAAAHHVYDRYRITLAQVVEAMDWDGYPA
jgi:hypothetical protein